MSAETSMLSMCFAGAGQPLAAKQRPVPEPRAGELLIRVHACGVCRTDLHVVDGDLTAPKPEVVPGHEIVGTVVEAGPQAQRFRPGDRVGVPWLGWTCGSCKYCRSGRENLCDDARFTGYTLDGGFAEYAVADERFCFALPESYTDEEAAPLLCAGLIGHRALRAAGNAKCIGIYGFGAAAHIIAQVARFEGRTVYAFTRPGDEPAQQFALSLGAEWAGDSNAAPPASMDAALIFAPVGSLVPAALRYLNKGGTVVCAGIHMSPLPSFDYDLLWGERRIVSVANLTRADGEDFLALAPRVPVRTVTQPFALAQANAALAALREGRLSGAAVLVPQKA